MTHSVFLHRPLQQLDQAGAPSASPEMLVPNVRHGPDHSERMRTLHEGDMDKENGVLARELDESNGVLRVALDEVGPPFQVETEDFGLQLRDSNIGSGRVLDVNEADIGRLVDIRVDVVDPKRFLGLC